MEHHFTSLIRRLLASNHILERIEISKMIIQFLNTSIPDFGTVELVMREHFITMIKVCTMHFDASKGAILIQLAVFYKVNYIKSVEELPYAA